MEKAALSSPQKLNSTPPARAFVARAHIPAAFVAQIILIQSLPTFASLRCRKKKRVTRSYTETALSLSLVTSVATPGLNLLQAAQKRKKKKLISLDLKRERLRVSGSAASTTNSGWRASTGAAVEVFTALWRAQSADRSFGQTPGNFSERDSDEEKKKTFIETFSFFFLWWKSQREFGCVSKWEWG